MSDGGSGPEAQREGGGSGRFRSFLRGRSGTQRIGAVAAVAILLTAPFGGLAEVDDSDDVAPVVLGEAVDIGPFDVTLRKVVSLGDLAPAVTPRPGRRLLVLDVTVTSNTDRPEPLSLASGAWRGQGTGAVPWDDGQPIELRVFSVDDASELDASEPVNPGQTVRVAMVLEQVASWAPDELELELSGYLFEEVDPFTLSDPAWELDEVVRYGHVEAEVEP